MASHWRESESLCSLRQSRRQMYAFSSPSSYTCHERPSKKKKAAAPNRHKFPHLHGGEIISSKDGVSKNQPLWCERGACVWSPPALETTGPVKCTTAQLHISFDCQFVLRIARSFELRLQMKANLVHSVATVDRCCCLFASGTIKGFGTIFFLLL